MIVVDSQYRATSWQALRYWLIENAGWPDDLSIGESARIAIVMTARDTSITNIDTVIIEVMDERYEVVDRVVL